MLPAMTDDRPDPGEFLLYQTEDGSTRIEVRMDGETVWLPQKAMAELFQTSVPNISMHVRNIFAEGELSEAAVVKDYLTTAADGKNYNVRHFNLDVIISVGYRVKSHRGTQFRIWATSRLREHLVKGFTLDDERFKRAGGSRYFEELLARIRDIRSSEKVFWKKVLEIYATSIDYDPANDLSKQFFATVQNKMHWAAHGNTAAEVVASRADAGKPNMGLTTWTGNRPRKQDVGIAKNYLNREELEALNRIVSFYLDFAELQAMNRRPMHMADWITKLDDFLKLSERAILTHAGKVSHEDAIAKAETEYEKYRALETAKPSAVERHFSEAVEKTKRIEQTSKPKKRGKPRQ
jgi:hypothetical protein